MRSLFIITLLLLSVYAHSENECSNAFLNIKKDLIIKSNYPLHHSSTLSKLKNYLNAGNVDPNMKRYFENFEKIITKNEHKKTKPFLKLEKKFNEAFNKLPEIINFMNSQQGKMKDREYYNKIVFEAVLVTFIKHVPEFLNVRTRNKDWARINKILSTIAQFDVQSSNVSFYKIKKVIEERYSLKEYIMCRVGGKA